MTDEKKPELAPEENARLYEQQQRAARDGVVAQFGATDAVETSATLMDRIGFGGGSGPGGFRGRTDFENHKLNAMLDLLEDSKPSDLEQAGEALEKATTELNKAAKELDDYVSKVEWKGEAAEEFRRFGKALAQHAWDIGTFANTAGAQMKVASTGLSSVINSRPRKRDDRADQKRPEDFPPSERKQDNPEYAKAVRVEADRQEAINQMNRLASFYAVSEETLAAQEPPNFPKSLKANVPQPSSAGPTSRATSASADSSSDVAGHEFTEHAHVGDTSGAPGTESQGAMPSVPERNASMQIDSVATPPAATTGATPAPTTTGVSGPTNNQAPPITSPFINPVQGGAPRPTNTSGVSRVGGSRPVGRTQNAGSSSPTAGRAGATGGTSPTAGRSGAPVGRARTVGSGPTAGRVGPVGAAGQTPIGGRPVAAGQSATGRAGTGAPATPSAGRVGGVVGGTPQRAAANPSGSRIPRGTVIGAEGATPGRAQSARPSQAGVIGANSAAGTPRNTGRGTPSTNGVVGTPRGGSAGPRPGSGAFTAGGSGLVGGRRGRGQSEDKEHEITNSARPDYLTEDEETWAVRRRGTVPPVVD
ncbi:hypothetical protein [Streptomyces sp. NPDC051776]|uniref:hypothetical protein n=1 Tax=Streptomyces sp. NPDC051776 TaxID=3155414 RepID=UPI0034465C65